MTLHTLLKHGQKVLSDNAPALLTALGVGGTVTTAVLTAKASYRASEIIHAEEPDHVGPAGTRLQRLKERVPLVWKLYIPPVTTGAVTITSIICANRISAKRAAAAYSLLTVTQQAFVEYRDEIADTIGPKKEEAVRDAIATRKMENNPPPSTLIVSQSKQLCCELYTGRYFESDMESLRRAVNDINHLINMNKEASLQDFYFLVGLPSTQFSDELGWTVKEMMGIELTSTLLQDGRTALGFTYTYVKPLHGGNELPCD